MPRQEPGSSEISPAAESEGAFDAVVKVLEKGLETAVGAVVVAAVLLDLAIGLFTSAGQERGDYE